ncbi:MAG: MmgE/PrpD family protein, partial [Pseudomonadota bacterium]
MNAVTFLHDLRFEDLPEHVVGWAETCLKDLLCVAAAGSETELSRLIRAHAASQFAAGDRGARMLFDGRRVSPAGAALAGGMTIDSVDAHDGWKPCKGHAGCGLLPSLIAFSEAEGRDDGREFLTALVIGYEVACRAGVALHGTVPDYHTSGAWVAVAVAGLGARAMRMDAGRTRHALGIAEYHGPRSQMMRCIDHPTMLKDGSGWGAMAGVSAAYLARDGFTGAPAITVEEAPEFWADLGSKWLIAEQYFKPSPVCRWAQAPMEAARALRERLGLTSEMIDHVEVESFHEAIRLHTRRPGTTEEAQYSLPHPVAAALVRGEVGPAEIGPGSFIDPEIARLAESMTLSDNEECNAAFPAHRYAYLRLHLKSGETLASERFEARGDPEAPLSQAEFEAKFRAYADPVVGA